MGIESSSPKIKLSPNLWQWKQDSHAGYRPDIDGLRAVAVLSVVFFHVFPEWIKGGFVGVDVFFVISGYLISSIILEGIENKNFSYLAFYRARIYRIFPVLILVLVVVLFIGWFTLFNDEYMFLGKHVIAGAGFLSNLALLREGGYFDISANLKPLRHLWSLAIEEQFYLGWPLLLSLAYKRTRAVLGFILGLAVLSFALNIWMIEKRPAVVFYFSFTRFWELMPGCALAYMVRYKSGAAYLQNVLGDVHSERLFEAMRNWAAIAGALLIVIAVAFLNNDIAYPGWAGLLPTTGAFLIIAAGQQAWLNRIVLSYPGLVLIGLISYPLYLWHWPALYFTRMIVGGDPGIIAKWTVIVASLALSWFSFRYVELFIRRARGSGIITARALCTAMVLISLVGLMAYKTWLPTRFPDAWQQIAWVRLEGLYPRSWDEGHRLKPYFLGDSAHAEILFIGDSHMETYYPRIKRIVEELDSREKGVAFLTGGGCPPFPGVDRIDAAKPLECADFFNQAMNFAKNKKFKKVVLGAYWDGYLLGLLHGGAKGPVLYASNDKERNRILPGSPEFANLFNALELELSTLTQAGTKVYLILPNPVSKSFDPSRMLKDFDRLKLGAWPRPSETTIERAFYMDRISQVTVAFRELSQRAGVILIDPVPHICGPMVCSNMRDGLPVNKDDNHLATHFVRNHADFIDEVFDFQKAH